MKRMKLTMGSLGVLTLALASSILSISPAQAAQGAGCGSGDRLCFFYSLNLTGASTNFSDGYMPDLIYPTAYRWPNNGAGAGEWVGNNAASARNTWGGASAIIYYSANFGQPSVTIAPNGTVANLGTLRNNNRSFRITE